eukprot:m.22695 g.22695  ORF g.22695 m.22695 type:complete len:535 (-) comp7428_c0_seq1:2359-3963(-)
MMKVVCLFLFLVIIELTSYGDHSVLADDYDNDDNTENNTPIPTLAGSDDTDDDEVTSKPTPGNDVLNDDNDPEEEGNGDGDGDKDGLDSLSTPTSWRAKDMNCVDNCDTQSCVMNCLQATPSPENGLNHLEKKKPLSPAVTGLIVGIVVCLCFGLAVYFLYSISKRGEDSQNRNYPQKAVRFQQDGMELLLGEDDRHREELLAIRRMWKIDPEEIELGVQIGAGAFGTVYKATWSGIQVAVKEIPVNFSEFPVVERPVSVAETELSMRSMEENSYATLSDIDATDESAMSDFEKEAKAMSNLRHPNIVQFYGAALQRSKGVGLIVVEYMSRGSLKAMLAQMSKKKIKWNLREQFCRDICQGMLYLHGRDPPVMHRDLKADNCFVSANYVVKVGDFGSMRSAQGQTPNKRDSSSLHGSFELTSLCGTLLWTAPEIMSTAKHGAAQYGPSADVYSFGIVLFEIATGLKPYMDLRHLSSMDLEAKIINGERPVIPKSAKAPKYYLELYKLCVVNNPKRRPLFTEIANILNDKKKTKK